MPIPANQIANAEIHMQGLASAAGSNNRRFDFVFHYRRTAVTSPLLKTALESVFQANVALPILAAINNRYAQTFNTVRWVNDAQDPPLQVSRAVVGGVAGDSMPLHNAVYVLFRTGLRGKSYRGSKHFGPVSEADTTAGTADILNAASLALWATAITAIGTSLTDSQGNVWNLSILSRTLSKLTKNPTTVIANDVTAILINKRVGRMRRREVVSVY